MVIANSFYLPIAFQVLFAFAARSDIEAWTMHGSIMIANEVIARILKRDEERFGHLGLIDSQQKNIFNHIEYDSFSLGEEYSRDVEAGTEIEVPHNYYPADNPDLQPQNRWRSHAHLLFGNWISEIYLTTPYDMSQIGQTSTDLRQ